MNEEKNTEKNSKDKETEPLKKHKGMLAVTAASIVFVICFVVMGAQAIESIRSRNEYKHWSELQSSLAAENTTQTGETAQSQNERPLLPIAEVMLSENPDAAGWIEIENTHINYPVVLRKSDTLNEYYLSHSFDGSENRKGTIFIDYRTTISPDTQSDNLVLYGHNESTNDMFGDLDLYKNHNGTAWCDAALEFYKKNPTINFNTNYDASSYKIIAIFVTMKTDAYDDIPLFDYHNYIDFTQARYDDFIDNIEKRNKLITNVDYRYGDKFLTLSTCSNEANDARLVIVARKLRDGESAEVDTSSAEFNQYPVYEHDWTEIYKNAG